SRLNNRGQDEPETIKKRMAEAVNETSHYSKYDFLIVNDKFEQALAELKSVVVSRRLHISLQKDRLANLINELLA
ncbi:MAG: guanylate kinase, partial [Gammaproteobacteria bacterium]|nr:guanylate kinase [Gammaproteobacteria bacterium]